MEAGSANRPYVIISSDCHAGANLRDYRPYLESRWHEEFDAWASSYSDAWAGIDTESEYKAGVSSFLSPLNWDSAKRLQVLESQGIVAEVIFPNTTPPFFPNGLLAAPGPRNQDEYERRWAGIQAHNRWLKDFCDAAPGRRFGVAQLFIDDVDDAVAEIRWAKENGLSQVLLPSDHHLKLHNLYLRRLDPIWSVCEELDMPVGRHGSVVATDLEAASVDEAHACGVFESTYFGHRTLFQMVLGGVFERHPALKVVFTELGASNWVFDTIARLEGFAMGAGIEGTIPNYFAGKAVSKLSLRPSEYVRRQCYFGATASITDFQRRHELGIDKLMWGADFPHHEGTVPYTLEVLRETVSEIPDAELRAILAGSAASLYGGDMAFLRSIADEVGFTPEQVSTPLTRSELPTDPNFHIMFARPTNVFTGAEA
jgi:predicted TIM-barrel fold metal-dependent hydrolase